MHLELHGIDALQHQRPALRVEIAAEADRPLQERGHSVGELLEEAADKDDAPIAEHRRDLVRQPCRQGARQAARPEGARIGQRIGRVAVGQCRADRPAGEGDAGGPGQEGPAAEEGSLR